MTPANRDDFTPSDSAAREAAVDPRRQVLLSASAGTGKTTVLTERYLELLKCGVSPQNILALTFTRKAAAEMKDRILGRLAEPGLRRELAELRNSVERHDLAEVQVSTIDAFNLGLVREFPLDAGVRPGVEILDERSLPVVRNEAIERVFAGAGKLDAEALATLPLLVGRTRGSLRQAAANYIDNRLTWSRRFEEQAKERGEEDPSVAEAPPQLGESLRERREAGRRLLDADRSARFLSLPARLALSGALGDLPAPEAEDRARARHALDRETLERFFRFDLKTPAKGLPKERREDWAAVEQALRDHRARWLAWRNDRAFLPMWNLFRAVEEEYRRLKEERGVMDFDDLTIAVTRMFRNLDEFSRSRFRLEARYHHLLLDEFQDTSDAQWELLQALMLPWTHGEGLAAEEVRRATKGRLERPTLFIVGDRKQSIYRFRNARVEILGKAEEWIAEKLVRDTPLPPPQQTLQWNFRSVRRLRRFFNRVSGAIAAESESAEGTDWAFRYEDSDFLPEEPGPKDRASDPALPVAVCVVPFEKGAARAAHEAAARRVAARIREVVEGGGAPEEVAILARAGSNLGIYREAVERAGIPTYLVKGWDFFSTSEVRDLTALCRFLARPHSDRRAVELLRSRFFALPGESLAHLKQASARPKREGPPGTPFADLLRSGGRSLPAGLDAATAASLRAAGEDAGKFRALARKLPPSTAIAEILRQTRYVERARRAAKYPHAGDQQAANLKKAIQHLRAVERSGFPTMERAARALEAAGDGDATQAPVRAAGAVQALTIHAAKGLEFDHVFLVDCGHRTGSDRGIPRVRETGEGWKIALLKDAPFWNLQDGGRADSEERRCMYVALTRARRTLTLSWIVSFRKDGTPSAAWSPRFLPSGLVAAANRTAREPADGAGKRPRGIEWTEKTPGRPTEKDGTGQDGTGNAVPLPFPLEVLPAAPPLPVGDPASAGSGTS